MTVAAHVLALAWGLAVLALAIRLRPPPARLRALLPGVRHGARPRPGRPSRLLEVVGSAVLRGLRRPSADAGRARLAGAVVLAAGPSLVVAPPLVPVLVLAGWALPRFRSRRREQRRLRRVEADVPETVDLVAMAVTAGSNVALAVAAAGRRGTGPLAQELRRVAAEVTAGRRLAEALEDLSGRVGEPARPLVSALVASERYGAPLGPALAAIADEVRQHRRRRAEEAARKVPVALLFPLVLCILPAFALLTVAPLIAGAMRELGL